MQGKHLTVLFHKQWTGIETFTKVCNPRKALLALSPFVVVAKYLFLYAVI